MSVEILITGFDSERAEIDLRRALLQEAESLADLVMQTAKSNIRHYPEVRNSLKKEIYSLGQYMIVADITADHWQAWLEQFGKGSLMAGPNDNPGLIKYMNSELWNRLRSRSTRIVVGRPFGRYQGMNGEIKVSRGGYAGVDLEELAERGDIDARFKPSPPTFFLRKALQSNRNRILQGLQHVVETFPYHNYFRR